MNNLYILKKNIFFTPAAYGALVPFLIVQQRTSSSPAVKKYIRSSAL
jgi:hypothetical protein